ncbi:Transcription factor [Aspergillus sclerotialis]|uniref:Transcription factor n=1 Tax=Aspergillus sclerotialis TaxID=2070753 RepID=A0A3A2ZGY7_9EURO|nr:Transcription factor [Aspergillus sclerotialis]
MTKRKSSGSERETINQQESRIYHPTDNDGLQPNSQEHPYMVSRSEVPSEITGLNRSESGAPAKRARQSDGSVVEVLSGITRSLHVRPAEKIRCDMPDDGPPCVRCRRRDLSCVLSRNLQSLLEDIKNTELIQSDVRNMHEALTAVCQQLELERPKPLVSMAGSGQGAGRNNPEPVVQGTGDDNMDENCEISPPQSPNAVQAPIDTFLDIAKLGNHKSTGTGHNRNTSRSESKDDLVSKGIITIEVAERLVENYFSRLDHYLYGIGGPPQPASKLRITSPILFGAICTVSALHDPHGSKLYVSCNRALRSLVSKSLFEKRDVEYIRALCISSFWLTDASRIFSSDAIRRAGDMRLHRSFEYLMGLRSTSIGSPSSLSTPTELADRVQLWYLLFICDQHLSILHNRDSLVRSDNEIAVSWESYLHRAEATESDVRILSQVSLLLIMGQVRDVLGSNNDMPLPHALCSQIMSFSRQLDKWFNRFSALFTTNAYIGEFPRRGLQLHYQFGKLYLGHQVFKGLHGQAIPAHLLTAAGMAHEAATAIFEKFLIEPELQQDLVGMPHYFHIMIAFAGHFLLEIWRNYHQQLSFKLENEFTLMDTVLTLFRNTPCIPQHPVSRMTGGLTRKMLDCAESLGMQNAINKGPGLSMPCSTGMSQNSQTVNIQAACQPPLGMVTEDLMQLPPEELFLSDLGEFNFPDLASHFTT